MNGSNDAIATKTPWHVWLVGIVALLWNAIGAVDYTMTESRNAAYMSGFTPEQLAYFYSLPKWAIATWALSVWGGVAGSILLLLRHRWTFAVFVLSLIAMLLTFLHNFVLSDGMTAMGGAGSLIFPAIIVLVGILLVLYARSLGRKGLLR